MDTSTPMLPHTDPRPAAPRGDPGAPPAPAVRPHRTDRPVLLLIVLLVVLLAAADLWAMHHLGVGIRNPGVLSIGLGAVAVAWAFVARFLAPEEREAVDDASASLRHWVGRFLLSPVLVAFLWTAFLVAVLLFSSVTVVAEPGAGAVEVTVSPLDDPDNRSTGRLDADRRQLRFARATSPLAGPYLVRAAGYLPTVVEAAPLLGARVQLGRDVGRAPGLLVRPDQPLQFLLGQGGHLRVRRPGPDTASIAWSEPRARGSFLLGRRRPGVSGREAEWQQELEAVGVVDRVHVSQHLQAWKRLQALDLAGDLGPGDSLRIELVAPNGEVVADRTVVLEPGDLNDVLLLMPDEEDGGSQ